MNPPYSTAIIGVSGYGKIYLERVLHHVTTGEFRIIAAAIINQAEEVDACRKLEAHGCKIYDDFRVMLKLHRNRLDLVLIPTGIPWHTQMTMAALEAGANVLVEKPLAMTMEEIRAVCSASERSGRFVAVGFQLMYAPSTRKIADLLQAGEIGRLYSLSGFGIWPRTPAYFRRNEWAGRVHANRVTVWDSPITNGLSHFLMLGLHWATVGGKDDFGNPEAELYRAQAIESYDTAALRLFTTTGVQLFFAATHSSRTTIDPILLLEGTRGRIIWTPESCLVERHDGTRYSLTVSSEADARCCLFESVIRRLRFPDEPICTPQLASLHTRCMSAIHDASIVHDIPLAAIRREPSPSNSDGQVYIAGIEAALTQAFIQRQLPGEIGFPWSRSATRVPVSA